MSMAQSSNRDALLAFDADFTTLVGILADDSRDAEIRRTLERFRNHPNRLGVALNSLLGLTRDEELPVVPAKVTNQRIVAAPDGFNARLPASSQSENEEVPEVLPHYQKQKQDRTARRDELLDPKKFLPNDFLAKFPDPVAYFNDTTRPVDSLYKQHALVQLLNEFPAFSEESLRQYLAVSSHHYYPAKKQIELAVSSGVQLQHHYLSPINGMNAGPGAPGYPAGPPAAAAAKTAARGGKRATKRQKTVAGPTVGTTTALLGRRRTVTIQWPQELCEEFFYELQFATHEKRILKRIDDLQTLRRLKLEMAREDGLSWECALCEDECPPEEASEATKGVCPNCALTFPNSEGLITAKELSSIVQTSLAAHFKLDRPVDESSVSYYVRGLGQQWQRLDNTATILLERFFHAVKKTANVSQLDFDFAKWTISLRNRSYVFKRQTDNIPVSWISNRSQITHSKIDLQPNSTEFKRILKVVCGQLKVLKTPVSKIQRIENITLHSLYQIQKAKIEKNCPKGCQVERMLFHGTSSLNIDGICENGFNRSRIGQSTANLGFFGAGTYFSPFFNISSGYARDGKLLYCNVLVGESIVGHYGMTMLPNKPNLPDIPYESAVDRLTCPTEIVIFADCNVYPAYLISL